MPRPPVFQKLTLEAAGAAAAAAERLLLVGVTGTKSPPCRRMEETTWRAVEVVTWVEQYAVAVNLDADDPTVQPLLIQEVPTQILFRGPEELGRFSGECVPGALIHWVESLRSWKAEVERLRARPRTDLSDRLRLARLLVRHGFDDEATDELAWLWEHSLEVDEAFSAVRLTYLISALQPLVARSTEARRRFAALCDAIGNRRSDWAGFRDWLTLSAVLGDDERIRDFLAEADAATAASLSLHDERHLLAFLERTNAWGLLGRLLPDPLALFREEHESMARTLSAIGRRRPSEDDLEMERTYNADRLRRLAVTFCRAMTAVNRSDDSRRIAEEAVSLDPSKEMAEAVAAWTGAI